MKKPHGLVIRGKKIQRKSDGNIWNLISSLFMVSTEALVKREPDINNEHININFFRMAMR